MLSPEAYSRKLLLYIHFHVNKKLRRMFACIKYVLISIFFAIVAAMLLVHGGLRQCQAVCESFYCLPPVPSTVVAKVWRSLSLPECAGPVNWSYSCQHSLPVWSKPHISLVASPGEQNRSWQTAAMRAVAFTRFATGCPLCNSSCCYVVAILLLSIIIENLNSGDLRGQNHERNAAVSSQDGTLKLSSANAISTGLLQRIIIIIHPGDYAQ